jgi:hypothetical protein
MCGSLRKLIFQSPSPGLTESISVCMYNCTVKVVYMRPVKKKKKNGRSNPETLKHTFFSGQNPTAFLLRDIL